MKVAVVLLIAVLAINATGLCRDEYTITKVQPTFVPTPNVGGEKRRSGGGGEDQWLAIEVDFKSTVELTDELTFSYYVALANKCLVGETTYVNVEKGRDLHAVMYISPRALRHLTAAKRASSNNIENITVQILSKGQPVAEKSMKPAPADWWKKAEAVKGIVLKKSETPFAWVDWDYYEELKPESH